MCVYISVTDVCHSSEHASLQQSGSLSEETTLFSNASLSSDALRLSICDQRPVKANSLT